MADFQIFTPDFGDSLDVADFDVLSSDPSGFPPDPERAKLWIAGGAAAIALVLLLTGDRPRRRRR